MFSVIKYILSSIVLSFEVIFRTNFGERYLTPGRALVGFIFSSQALNLIIQVYVFYTTFTNTLFGAFLTSSSYSRANTYTYSPFLNFVLLSLFSFISLILLIVEVRKVQKRKHKGVQWHSWNSGVERAWIVDVGKTFGIYQLCNKLFGKYVITRFITQLYVEPIVLFGVGLILLFSPLVGFLGAWFIFGSIILCLKSNILYSRFKNQYLDAIDSQIEAEHFTDALIERKAPEETGGFTPMSLSHPITEDQKKSVAQSMQSFEEKNPNLSGRMKKKPTIVG